MLSSSRSAAMRHELTADKYIPYTAHVASHVVKTALGDYLQVFRLGGASFESADVERRGRCVIEVDHERSGFIEAAIKCLNEERSSLR